MNEAKNLIDYFLPVNDPRIINKSSHKLIDIIVISICGFIGKCDTFVDIEEYGNSKIDWFKNFLDLPNGIPSHDTFGRVFSLIDPLELQNAFYCWAQSLADKLSLDENVINIDGKYIFSSKGAIRKGSISRKTFFGMVNAWSSSAGIALAQLRTDFEKKNEVEATRELLNVLRLKGATVTLDAMSSQPETTVEICNRGGDYVIALKRNQRKLYKKAEDLLAVEATNKNSFTTIDDGHGRFEVRTCTAKRLSKKFLEDLNKYYQKLNRPTWSNLKYIFKIEFERTLKNKTTKETRYYLTSRAGKAEMFLNLARSHWAVENKLHYVLDVSFDEDHCRVRNGFAGENLAVIRQLSLNLLKQEKTSKRSINGKRLKCGWQNDYLEKVILGMGAQDIVI